TGRAGRSGLAFTLAVHSERHKVRRIEHYIGQPIPATVIEGPEPQKTVRPTYTDRKPGRRFGPRGGVGGKPGYGRTPAGDPGQGDKPACEGKPRFGDKPSYEGKPRFGDRSGYEGRPAYDRSGDNRKSFGGDDRSGGYKGRGDKPAFGDRPARSERPRADR